MDSASDLALLKRKPKITDKLANFSDDEVLEAIHAARDRKPDERPVKQVELDAILAAPEGFGDDVPIDQDFHARRLPDKAWRLSKRSDGIASVIQLHRLREVLALTGFTRFEAVTPDIQGEFETDVERAEIAIEPQWFPAVENRGEGVFVQLQMDAVKNWLDRPAVKQRIDRLATGHALWVMERKSQRPFPGGPYVLLHTLSHLLLQSLAMRCGYPASSIRERIYADGEAGRFGILLYTGSPDADGTLGGLVQEARHLYDHLAAALRMSALCSNDPVCAQHAPGESIEARWLHGAACHGCALIAETSCEMRNALSGSSARCASSGPCRRWLLPSPSVIHALLDLPTHLRMRLASALEAGALTSPHSAASLTSVLGVDVDTDGVVGALADLEQLGISGPAAGAWMRTVEEATSRGPKPDLVWSGPEVPSLHARDTRRVYEELLGSAVRSIWASTYAYFDGPRAFEVLAKRMDSTPDLRVTLLLNIQRARGDTTAAETLIRKFADRFWGTDWPGVSRPAVYFDPRSLEHESAGGVLHAKAVVADDERVFITSANLTEAALDRNIELGLLVHDRSLAQSVAAHFRGLIDIGLLKLLPAT